MLEICYCGKKGKIEDRLPVTTVDGARVLSCPGCGHEDGLKWLPDETRTLLLAAAEGELSPAAGPTVEADDESGQRPEGGSAATRDPGLGDIEAAHEDDAPARSMRTPRRRNEHITEGAYT